MSAACCVNGHVNSRFVLSQEESGGRYWRIQTWKTALDHAGSEITSETEVSNWHCVRFWSAVAVVSGMTGTLSGRRSYLA